MRKTPVVPTVSGLPVPVTARSTASAISAPASKASRRPGMSVPPACPPTPVNCIRSVLGAAIFSTMPMAVFSRSRIGPCSMCNSTKAA